MTITQQLSTALADRYQILSHLGEGGMATVYLAQDVKHDRKVALKVLRPELAAVIGAERFLQEIKVTANLQHPHILPLHDSGEAGSFLFYVMPYVEGDTLRDKLNREKQLDITEAIEITRSVASALDYAHRQGVIHRDIKPENVLLHDGQALIADFGIALAVSHASGTRLTETGLSIGTPHYMSPEQAMGDRELDARSDIYSLGAMLYEMLAGEPPYTGSSAQAIVAKVITEKAAPVTAVRDTVPGHVAAAVGKALAKMPADRFKTAAAFADALTNPAFTLPATTATGAEEAKPARSRKRLLIGVSMVAVVAVVMAAVGWMRSPNAPTITRLDLSLGSIVPSSQADVVISPDGSMLAVSATVGSEQAIYLRRIGEADFRKVPDTDNGRFPSFSPDGQWLVFRDNSENTLVKVAVAGGGALTLVDDDAISPFDPHWGENDVIVFTGPQGIFTVSATGGVPRQHTISASGRNPHLLPDGRGALIVPGGAGGSSIEYLDLESDSSWVIVPEGRHATYVATGHVLYAPPSGGLFAVPFDLDAREVTGPPRRVLNRVAFSNVRRGYSVSRRGILVHLEGEGVAFGTGGLQTRFLIVDRAGAIDTIRHPSGVNFDPRFSPDGRKIAYEFAGRGGESHIYTYDLLTGTNPQITFEGDNDDPEWSPDGTRLMFNSDRGESGDDIYVKAADNSGEAELVLSRPGGLFVSHWFREDTILVEALDEQLDLLVHSGLADDTARPFLQAPWDEFVARVSPDGKLVAYSSEETGEEEIWLQDFPVPAGKRRVSFGGDAAGARWSPDGSLLYFWRAGGGRTIDSLFSVRIERTPSVVVHQPEYVFGTDITGGSNSWDLHPDGERFVITVAEGSPEPAAAAASGVPATRYLVVLNWFEELKERLGNR